MQVGALRAINPAFLSFFPDIPEGTYADCDGLDGQLDVIFRRIAGAADPSVAADADAGYGHLTVQLMVRLLY